MRFSIVSFVTALAVGAAAALATVTVTAKESGTGNSSVTVTPGSTVSVDLLVAESGEGTGISGVQLALNVSGPAAGMLAVSGPADTGGTSAAINGAEWDSSIATTGTGLALPTGNLPISPVGAGYVANGGKLSGAVTASSRLVTVQVAVSPSAPTGAYQLTTAGLAFPDFVGTNVSDITVTPGAALTVNVGSVVSPATVADHGLFYFGSSWGTTPIPSSNKSVLAWTGSTLTATFNNVITHTRGITGFSVDIANRAATTPTAADFEFRNGTTGSSAAWPILAVTPTVTVSTGVGTGGSDRIYVTFANNAIPDPTWLRVTLKSDANGGTQGLTSDEIFYIGSLIGDTGSTGSAASVVSSDYNAVYSHRNTGATITDPWDLDRSKAITSADYNAAYAKRNHTLTYTIQP